MDKGYGEQKLYMTSLKAGARKQIIEFTTVRHG